MKFFRLPFKLTVLLGAFLLWIAPYALADIARTYQVELIIFSHLSSNGLNSEDWPISMNSFTPDTNATKLAPPSSNQKYLKLLSPQYFTLANEQSRLDKYASTYHTILHAAWRQQVFEPRYAQSTRIFGGHLNDNGGSEIPEVEGTIRISVEHYLNVHLNLVFATPAKPIARLAHNNQFAKAPNGLVYFHLKENRRMRSNELNYIDFPLYGVLIKITPISS